MYLLGVIYKELASVNQWSRIALRLKGQMLELLGFVPSWPLTIYVTFIYALKLSVA